MDLGSVECDYSQSVTGPRRRSRGKKSRGVAKETKKGEVAVKDEEETPQSLSNFSPSLPYEPLEGLSRLFPDIYGDGDFSWEPSPSTSSSTVPTPSQSPFLPVADLDSLPNLDLHLLQIDSTPSSSTSERPVTSANPFSNYSLDLPYPVNDLSPIDYPESAEQAEFAPLRPELVYEAQEQGGSLGEYEWEQAILEVEANSVNPSSN